MTFDLDVLHAGSSYPYLGQVRRSRSWVSVHRRRIKSVSFSAVDANDDVFWLFIEFFVLG